MATINNSKVFFAIASKEDDVARRSFRPAGKAGHRMNSYHPADLQGDAETLAMQMATFTIGQVLASAPGHYMIVLPEQASIKFFTAQKAIKNGTSFEDTFAYILDDERRSDAYKAAVKDVYDAVKAVNDTGYEYDVQIVQRHRLVSWNVEAMAPDSTLEEGMTLNFVDGINAINGVKAEINTLNGEFTVNTYTVRHLNKETGVVEDVTKYAVARKGTAAANAVITKELNGEELTKADHAVKATKAYALLKTDLLVRQDIPDMEEFDDEEEEVAGEAF